MRAPTFSGKPSDAHIIWREETTGGEKGVHKRFDEAELRAWCEEFSVDYSTETRVDHTRAEEKREQYRCVFAWSDSEGESFDVGDDSWDIQTQKTPRTFVEIDSEGISRVKSWDREYILDFQEVWHEGSMLAFKAAELDSTQGLDAAKLTRKDH
jgi:hypothetical protein